MMNFDKSFEIIVGVEGGYTNDSQDRGGETKFGVSKKSYPNEDIKNLTLERAKEIYYEDYWLKASCDKLVSPLNLFVFDAAVNSGTTTAIKTLQKSVGVPVDGIIGKNTLSAADRAGIEQFALFLANRGKFYTSLNDFGVFGIGWLKRLFIIAFKSQQ